MTSEEPKKSDTSWIIPNDLLLRAEANAAKYRVSTDFSKRLFTLSDNLISQFSQSDLTTHRFLPLCFFLRISNSYKSAVRECMLVNWIEAQTLARPILEALVYLAEACQNESFDDQYSRSQDIVRRKLIQDTLEDMKRPEPLLKHPEGIDLQLEFKKIQEAGHIEFNFEKLAAKNGMAHLYSQIYNILHNSTHVKPNSTALYLFVKDDTIVGFNPWPETKDPEYLLNIMNACVALACEHFAKFYGLQDRNPEISRISEELERHATAVAKEDRKKGPVGKPKP